MNIWSLQCVNSQKIYLEKEPKRYKIILKIKRDSFSKLPLKHEMDEIFFKHLTWKLYKKKLYEQLLSSERRLTY